MRQGAVKESSFCERVVSPLQDDETIGSKGRWINLHSEIFLLLLNILKGQRELETVGQ